MERRRSFTTAKSINPKPLPRRFELVIQQAGNRRAWPTLNREAQSTCRATKRFWRRRIGWRSTKEFLSSWPAPPRSRGLSSAEIEQALHIRFGKFQKPDGL